MLVECCQKALLLWHRSCDQHRFLMTSYGEIKSGEPIWFDKFSSGEISFCPTLHFDEVVASDFIRVITTVLAPSQWETSLQSNAVSHWLGTKLQSALSWWRHQMETFSALLAICAGNSPVPGEFPTQRPVTRSFDVYFDLRPDERLSKQSWCWWFETLSHSLWRHRNGIYPTPGCENQWILPVVYYVVDTTNPNSHIGYHTLICTSLAQGLYIYGINAISGDSRFLLMANVNGMQRLYISLITLFFE